MLWNFMMHALMGWLGPTFFTLTPEGIAMALLVVCVTQAVDQIRLKKLKQQEIEALPEQEREPANQALKQVLLKLFVQNVMIFTGVLLIAAQVARTHGWW